MKMTEHERWVAEALKKLGYKVDIKHKTARPKGKRKAEIGGLKPSFIIVDDISDPEEKQPPT